ncbi:MAG TPA: hypothetical protein VM262_10780 [Acidimicrobiales bacterium]|nr:hypothetical protein [Acidimicrobiales bacterium]
MADDRYVLLGLGRPRSAWFSEVSRWATAAIVPAEFVKCVSPEEVRARLASGRSWSAALLDGSLPAVDRDLLAAARDAGCAPIVVDDRETTRWRSIGAAAVLPSVFDRGTLLDVLASVARSVEHPVHLPDLGGTAGDDGASALVAAVCGPGGTGASTCAAALAQGLAASGRATVLADLALHAEQAVLHDVHDIVPGIQELVEAHRNGTPSDAEVKALTFEIVERGYAVLLGLRRARHWPTLRPRAFAAAFASLRGAFDALVCDITADFEGEDDAGSADVEERNVAARTASAEADVVVVVGRPGVKGVHALIRVIADVAGAGTPAARVLPVFVAAPRAPRARAEITSAVAELVRPALGGAPMASPLFLPGRSIEPALRDGVPFPGALTSALASGVTAVAERAGARVRAAPEPRLVAPGALGAFSDGAEA